MLFHGCVSPPPPTMCLLMHYICITLRFVLKTTTTTFNFQLNRIISLCSGELLDLIAGCDTSWSGARLMAKVNVGLWSMVGWPHYHVGVIRWGWCLIEVLGKHFLSLKEAPSPETLELTGCFRSLSSPWNRFSQGGGKKGN